MAVAATVSPSPLERYVDAIARRNVAWARYHDARLAWLAAGKPTGPLLGAMNDEQYVYEGAARDLVRARAALGADRT